MDYNICIKAILLLAAIGMLILLIVGNIVRHNNYITLPMQGVVELWCSSQNTLYLVSSTDITPLLDPTGRPTICLPEVEEDP